jgi:hypothetical protein
MLFIDYSHVPPVDFNPLYGFLGLEISTSTAESGWELGFVYIISLFFLFLYFILTQLHLLPIETTIRNGSKGKGKPDRKPYHPYVFRNPNKTIN